MIDTNYVGSIVKILEIPEQKLINENNIPTLKIRAQLSQFRGTKIINLSFWGNLAYDVANYYKINDYILIEGYLTQLGEEFNEFTQKKLKKIEITVSKIYPISFSSNNSIKKI